jgi:DNA-binding FrmR family transcriptional regulator
VIVRKDYMSDLQNRIAVMERSLQRLNDVLKGHLTPCVDNHSSSSARPSHRDVSPLATARTDQDLLVSQGWKNHKTRMQLLTVWL